MGVSIRRGIVPHRRLRVTRRSLAPPLAASQVGTGPAYDGIAPWLCGPGCQRPADMNWDCVTPKSGIEIGGGYGGRSKRWWGLRLVLRAGESPVGAWLSASLPVRITLLLQDRDQTRTIMNVSGMSVCAQPKWRSRRPDSGWTGPPRSTPQAWKGRKPEGTPQNTRKRIITTALA